MQVAQVLIAVALDAPYSYKIPKDMVRDIIVGRIVQVPLRGRLEYGIVVDVCSELSSDKTLKPIHAVCFDLSLLAPAMLDFINRMASYTLIPKGYILRMVLRYDPKASEPKTKIAVRWEGEHPSRMTKAREKVLHSLDNQGMALLKQDVVKEAGVSASVIDGLVDEGVLTPLTMVVDEVFPSDPDYHAVCLNEAQKEVAETLCQSVIAQKFHVELFQGVTGAGKTEVYFEAIAAALRQEKQILVLLPEITLTSGFLHRFEQRFGVAPHIWHSGLSKKKRARLWQSVQESDVSKRVDVVVGARSALFLPFQNLGLIIVDEEHDASFKQTEQGAFHGRDMAVLRAQCESIPVVLVSATPSIESMVNVQKGRYEYSRIDARFSKQSLADVQLIDMRHDKTPSGKWLSPKLIAAATEKLAQNEQVLFFLNRRGYAPLTLCQSCGHRYACPNCSAWLTQHFTRSQLLCHHCGYCAPVPQNCDACGAEDKIVPVGPGVERIAHEVREIFPEARISLLSSDMYQDLASLRAEISLIEQNQIDIIIGTQLVAKGYHFPNLTLVGVVDADIGLGYADPRTNERIFQLLHQVSGRAGRSKKAGLTMLQTYQPHHDVLQALCSGDMQAFYAQEIEARQEADLPPFCRIASVLVSCPDALLAEKTAYGLRRQAPQSDKVQLLGPAVPPMAKLRNRYRFRILAKSDLSFNLPAYLRQWLPVGQKQKQNIQIEVDVDPLNFA